MTLGSSPFSTLSPAVTERSPRIRLTLTTVTDVAQTADASRREVSADLRLSVLEPTALEFQVAVARVPGLTVDETVEFTVDGEPVRAHELIGPNNGRIHCFDAPRGSVRAAYRASVIGTAVPSPLNEFETSLYLRPSRYAETDKLFGFAAREFGTTDNRGELVRRVVEYVADLLDYVPGSSDPIDGAVDTLLSGAGVCRDYAHLVIALLRASNVPARLVAVYAPGCDPMDFHAIAEALVDGRWQAVDATRLAPRQTMLRISTGRDSADTAFLDNHGGAITLDHIEVSAVVEGDLPVDDPAQPIVVG